MKYIKYFKYLLRHKWFVFVECAKEGLIYRGLIHDMSKFLPDELTPYVNYFYGKKDKPVIGKHGFYKSKTGDEAFNYAWLLHQKRNKHHWQWWVLLEDSGKHDVLEMTPKYAIEMLCDWIGAGKAQGKVSPNDDPHREVRLWYLDNKDKMVLHEKTRTLIEKKLGIL